MNIGVKLRSQVVDANGASCDIVKTGGSHRVKALNCGIISYQAEMRTEAFGDGSVTNMTNQREWTEQLVIPASGGGDQRDTKLKVEGAGSQVIFHTIGRLRQLGSDDGSLAEEGGYYQSQVLEVSAITA